MQALPLRIAHISDLHFGSRYWPGTHNGVLSDSLAEHIAGQNPDLILCTGDVVNGALTIRGYKHARRFFDAIRKQCAKAIIRFTPGNHDYACSGIAGLKKIFQGRFDSFAGQELLTPAKPFVHNQVAIFGFDSNPTFLFGHARGRISQRQITEFSDSIQELAKSPKQDIRFRIAALHHHPLPIPYTSSDTNVSMTNAGLFLFELAKNDIDLVLHGHKHFSHSSRWTYFVPDRTHQMIILGTGSATKRKDHQPEGNAYNIISIWPEGSVACDSFFVQEGGTLSSSCDRSVVCRPAIDACQDALERAHQQQGYKIKTLSCSVDITEFGDATYEVNLQRLKVLRNRRLTSIPFKQRSSFGQFGQFKVLAEQLPQPQISEKYYEEEGRSWHEVNADVLFRNELNSNSDSIDIPLQISLNGGFALNRQEQEARLNPPLPGMEWVRIPIEYPADALHIKIASRLKNFVFSKTELAVYDPDGQRNYHLEGRPDIILERELCHIHLFVPQPMFGASYELRWVLPEAITAESEEGIGDARAIRSALLNQNPSTLCEMLKPLMVDIEEKYRADFSTWRGKREEIEISFFFLMKKNID
jgi:3',5'-cyclic AMP phosphodiesterase CpdA